MAINRTTILTGPCLLTYAGQTIYSKGDVTLKPVNERFDIATASFGKVDERGRNRRIEVSFEPDGRFTAALAAVLWPYAATPIGASLYGAIDRPLVIHSKADTKVTVVNAAITTMPSLRLGVAQTIQGNCVFTGLLKNNADPSAAGAYYTIATEAYPGDAGFSVADIKTLAYASAWGAAAPWSAFNTEGGWEISFGLQTAAQAVDGLGTVDMTLQGLDVTATAIPVGPSEADVLSAMKIQGALGSSIATANDLTVSATGVHVIVRKAGMVDADLGYGPTRKRIGRCQWIATRSVTGGTPDPLFYVGTAAPA